MAKVLKQSRVLPAMPPDRPLRIFTVQGMYKDNQQYWLGHVAIHLSESEFPQAVLEEAWRQVQLDNGLKPRADSTWEDNDDIEFLFIFPGTVETKWEAEGI